MRIVATIILIATVWPLAFGESAPYELKGITLGVSTLAEFKTKFHHCADNCSEKLEKKYYHSKFAPFCSDENPYSQQTPDRAQDAEPWTKAGLVFCQPYYPFEGFQGKYFTIADINTTACFEFFQEKVYRISAAFLNAGGTNFKAMLEALTSKYGPATSQETREYQNSFGAKISGRVITWDNGVSKIVLTEFGADKDTSAVEFTHTALQSEAEKAAPKHSSKDL